MLNFSFGKPKEEFEPQDLLIVVSDDDRTVSIAPVETIDGERVFASSAVDGRFSVPLGDVKAYTGTRGRIMLYGSTVENIQDTKRLAALERSIVLRQITHFAPEPGFQPRSPLLKILLISGGIFFLFILLMVAVAK